MRSGIVPARRQAYRRSRIGILSATGRPGSAGSLGLIVFIS
ncbi:MAG: hypothetical protein ACTHK7_16350 [Aureliella sp.]